MTAKERRDAEKAIGYTFNDPALLESAFTHSSYVNEHGGTSNERLEFIGDALLNFDVGVQLFRTYPDETEGALSSRRSSLVSRKPLARLVDELGLVRFLQVGAGVDKSKFSEKVRSDLFESVLGAIYIDGGAEPCRSFLAATFYGNVEPERDFKSALQEFAAKRGSVPEYRTEEGQNGFVAELTVCGRSFIGTASTKHGAQIAAARAALDVLDRC